MPSESKNRNKRKLIALYTILVLTIGLMAFFAIALVFNAQTARQAQAFYSALAIDFIPRPNAQIQPVTTGLLSEHENPHTPEYFVSFVDFDALRKDLPNLVGWIQSEGTPINYPIVRGTDNDFYLYHFPNGQRNPMGSIFMDYRNSANFTDVVTKIYGHNTASGHMFGTLSRYSSQEFFQQHSSMFIFTPYRNYKLLLFAGYVVDSAFEIPPMNFPNEDYFYAFIYDIRNRSVFLSDFNVQYGDRLVLLCTCTTLDATTERLIIAGKLAEM